MIIEIFIETKDSSLIFETGDTMLVFESSLHERFYFLNFNYMELTQYQTELFWFDGLQVEFINSMINLAFEKWRNSWFDTCKDEKNNI